MTLEGFGRALKGLNLQLGCPIDLQALFEQELASCLYIASGTLWLIYASTLPSVLVGHPRKSLRKDKREKVPGWGCSSFVSSGSGGVCACQAPTQISLDLSVMSKSGRGRAAISSRPIRSSLPRGGLDVQRGSDAHVQIKQGLQPTGCHMGKNDACDVWAIAIGCQRIKQSNGVLLPLPSASREGVKGCELLARQCLRAPALCQMGAL